MSATDAIDRASLETPDKRAPSLGLLIKLLKMTTSNRDGEALAFLRRANLEVEKFGGWEKLLSGKVTVFADPFTDLPNVKASGAAPPPPSPRPSAHPQPYSYAQKPWTPPPSAPPPSTTYSTGGQKYHVKNPAPKRPAKTTVNLSDL